MTIDTQVWEMSDQLHDRVAAAVRHQYELEGEIGRGGMSVVYRARDLRLNRPVAIKVLPPELAHDPAVRVRFTREAQTSAQLAHPHITPIYDVGENEGLAYLVMAFVTGGSLSGLLAREPRQPIEEVRRFVCEIADALAYAHVRGVIHRDVKPDNILLDQQTGRTAVTDFGIARAVEAGTRLTVTGIAVGTPTYMSPEQAEGAREIDGRTDIYSLGVLGYQMLTGRVPFTAGNSMALLLKHVSERPRPIAELRPEAPRALREAIERALQKDPEDRWPTASAMRDALLADGPAAAWRSEPRDHVRYTSPKPDVRRTPERQRDSRGAVSAVRRATPAPAAPASGKGTSPGPAGVELIPEHLASLTDEQRKDLRLWHGRIQLLDRIKAARGYLWLTLAAFAGSMGAVAGGIEGEIPPLVLAPIIPLYMSRKLWRRGRSLRRAGLKLRRVFLMPRAKWVLPRPPRDVKREELEKLAPSDVLDGPHGRAIRVAAEDRAAILAIVASLPKADRALLPEVVPTVRALVQRVADLAQSIQRLDQGIDPDLGEELEARVAAAAQEPDTPERERRLGMLRRQRATMDDLVARRDALRHQLDNAAIALANLRLDLIKLRSSGVQAALSDVTSATQEARALSREIGAVLAAAAEVREL